MLPGVIAQALENGRTVLTSNQRAARTLRAAFDRERMAAGAEHWAPPAIVAWEAWTAELWGRLVRSGAATGVVLNRAQEHAVWRGIIEADAEASGEAGGEIEGAIGGLVAVDALATMAAEAWERLCAYRGERRLREAAVSVDTRAFARWAARFVERCRSEGYVAAAQMEAELTRAVATESVAVASGGYVLVGFDRVTPAQEALAAAVRGRGIAVEAVPLEVEGGGCVVTVAEDAREELQGAARWLRERLEAYAGAEGGPRLALVVPGLEGRRAEVDRALREALAPELEEITTEGEAPFEFSLGVPVARTTLGATALDLLRWTMGPLPLERVSGLLLSPCWGGEGMRARAELDAYRLRRGKRLRPEIGLEEMVRLVEGSRQFRGEAAGRVGARPGVAEAEAAMEAGVEEAGTGMGSAAVSPVGLGLGRLAGALRGMRRAAEVLGDGGTRSYSDWTEAVRAVLTAAGWGEGADSLTFQARRRWESVLDTVATLDFTGVRVGVREALGAVTRLAGETLFAPESRRAAVQVMGPLESAGSVFDGVWFLGAGELEWPVRGRVSPLLSWGLQRELGMPGAAREADSAYAERMTRRLAGCAGTVVWSYAAECGQGRQGVAGVVAGVVVGVVEARQGAAGSDRREGPGRVAEVAVRTLVGGAAERAVVELEALDDSESLPPVPDQVMKGGATVLKLQAACGFRAFAERRLWATPLAVREMGMDARERGEAVHKALELFWKQVQTQAALRALTVEERRGILTGAVEAALRKTGEGDGSAWSTAYLEVQRARLLELLDAWLGKEMEREVPFTVRQSETELEDVSIGPLRLSLRVDRVDETEFGDVIVDYKTGAASAADWMGERPEEPQLPLYAVLAGESEGGNDLAGVAFGQVRAGKDMALQGYQTQDGVLLKGAKLKEAGTLEEQVERWRGCLTTLAEDFHRGDVRVRPKSYPKTCGFCEQRLLCRLDVSVLEAGTAEETDEGDGEGERG